MKDQNTQKNENARTKVGTDQHMMPGLANELVNDFYAPARFQTVTTRGVARKRRVRETFVNTALFRDLKDEVRELRRLIGPRASVAIVRKGIAA